MALFTFLMNGAISQSTWGKMVVPSLINKYQSKIHYFIPEPSFETYLRICFGLGEQE